MEGKYDYKNNPPIRYDNQSEQAEAVKLGIKLTILQLDSYPMVGRSYGSTNNGPSKKELLEAIPWSTLRLQYIEPVVKLSF